MRNETVKKIKVENLKRFNILQRIQNSSEVQKVQNALTGDSQCKEVKVNQTSSVTIAIVVCEGQRQRFWTSHMQQTQAVWQASKHIVLGEGEVWHLYNREKGAKLQYQKMVFQFVN